MKNPILVFSFLFLVSCSSAPSVSAVHNADNNIFRISSQPILQKYLNEARESYDKGMTSDDSVKTLEVSMKIQPMIRAKSFKDIFTQADRMGKQEVIHVSDVVTQYIKRCCETREEAISLLRDSGFEIIHQKYRDSDKDFMEKKRRQLHITDEDEGYIYASKLSGILRSDIYEVRLYIREGEVNRATGIIKDRYPPL